MAISFQTNPYVGQTGQLGKEYEVQYRRWKSNETVFGQSSFYGNLVTQGINSDNVLLKMEDEIGYEPNSLSWGRSVGSNDNSGMMLFKDTQGTFAEINFNKNNYTIKNERSIAEDMGLYCNGMKMYDVLEIDQGGVNIYDFKAMDNDGIQNSTGFSRQYFSNCKWGALSYLQTELNLNYLLADYDSEEGMIGQNARTVLFNNASQFMSNSEIKYLNSLYKSDAYMYLATLVNQRLF